MKRTLILITTLVLWVCCASSCGPRAAGPTFMINSVNGLDYPAITACEIKGEHVYITLIDDVKDSHIFELDYSKTGLTQQQAFDRITAGIKARETAASMAVEPMGE